MNPKDIENLIKQRYGKMSEDDKEFIRDMFHSDKSGPVLRRFMGGSIANTFRLRKPKRMAVGEQVMQEPTMVQTPGYIGGHNPQATPQQTIADDKPMDAKDGDYIINAAAAEYAGKQDIQRMINSAVSSLQEKGVDLRFGNPTISTRDNVKLLVSQNEVFIPKELAKEIGYDRLGKINNRGKKRTQQIQEQVAQKENNPIGAVRAAEGVKVQKQAGVVEDSKKFIQDKVLPLFGIGGQGDLPSEKYIPKAIEPKPEVQEGFIPTPPTMPKGMREERTRVNEILRLTEGAVNLSEGPIKTKAYIPKNLKKQILGVSGVTIGRGVDLGQHSVKTLKDAGFTEQLINRFKPYLGLKTKKAQKALNKTPLNISSDEAKFISDQMLQYKIDEYDRVFKSLKDVPDPKIKAVLAAEHFAGRLGLPVYSKFKKALKDTNYNLERAYSIGVLNNRDPDMKSHYRNAAKNLLSWYKDTLGVEIKNVDPKEIQIKKLETLPEIKKKPKQITPKKQIVPETRPFDTQDKYGNPRESSSFMG